MRVLPRAFSEEVDTGSSKENAASQEARACIRSNWIGSRSSALILALTLAGGPAHAQLGPAPPEYVAQQTGGFDCGRLVREIGPQAVVVGAFRNDGPTNIEGVDARFEFQACFRAIENCERFVIEMQFDYPRGQGACRRPGE